MLYTLKIILPSLTASSKTFQTGVINFSKIVLNALKTITKFRQLFDNGESFNLLKNDLCEDARLRSCNFQINEEKERVITNIVERYNKTTLWNIDERFPSDVSEVFEAFSIFDLELVLTDYTYPMNLLIQKYKVETIFVSLMLVLTMKREMNLLTSGTVLRLN